MNVTFEVEGLDEMRAGIRAWEARVYQAVEEVAKLIAVKLEAAAKQNAPWKDDSGEARKGLFAKAEWESVVSSTEWAIAGRVVSIYLSHGSNPDIYYGIFLELGRGQKYAVIMPTIYSFFPEIEALMQGIFSG